MKIDFFARRTHFVDHLLPVWQKIPQFHRGQFYVPDSISDYVPRDFHILETCKNPVNCYPPYSENPMVVCAYGDMERTYSEDKKTGKPIRNWIMMEHGVGLTPAPEGDNAGYAGGLGLRKEVSLFLAPNEYIASKTAKVLDTHQVVIGTPKLDKWSDYQPALSNKVAISFHWNGSHISSEAGNAFTFYKPVLEEVSKKFSLLGHGHPKSIHQFKDFYDSISIPTIEQFELIMHLAGIYVNDCSSTLYEFLVTGKPVIILNAPWFRKGINWGIRFWDYTNVGLQVNRPEDLSNAILSTLEHPEQYKKQRDIAVRELYPNIGRSSQIAADAILKHCEVKVEKTLIVKKYETLRGLLSGDNNTTKGISDKEIQHLSWLGSQVRPNHIVIEVGSHRGKSACAIGCGIRDSGTENVFIYCIDLWTFGTKATSKFDHYSSQETWNIFNAQIAMLGLTDVVVPKMIDSAKAAQRFTCNPDKPPVDLLFIDARHDYEWVLADYQNWHENVAPGGYIAFHDYGTRFPGVDKVINDYVIPSGLWEDFTVVDRIWSARRK